jgi:hypothetical protein
MCAFFLLRSIRNPRHVCMFLSPVHPRSLVICRCFFLRSLRTASSCAHLSFSGPMRTSW